MRLNDNINSLLGEYLKDTLKPASKLKIAASCFSIFVKQFAAHKPLRAVFRDPGFVSDSVEINVEQVLKLLSPATEIKTL